MFLSLQTQMSHPPVMDHAHHQQQHSEAVAAAQQQQQQLAMLQMYGVHPSTGVQPGYMAVPTYSTMPVQFIPQVTNSVAILNPAGEHVYPVQIPSSQQQYAQPVVVPTGGSWMAPVPVVGGNCVINPMQAGILATPWVK